MQANREASRDALGTCLHGRKATARASSNGCRQSRCAIQRIRGASFLQVNRLYWLGIHHGWPAACYEAVARHYSKHGPIAQRRYGKRIAQQSRRQETAATIGTDSRSGASARMPITIASAGDSALRAARSARRRSPSLFHRACCQAGLADSLRLASTKLLFALTPSTVTPLFHGTRHSFPW